jgi:hypothetical protein
VSALSELARSGKLAGKRPPTTVGNASCHLPTPYRGKWLWQVVTPFTGQLAHREKFGGKLWRTIKQGLAR